jgi:hypothetical protein
MTVKAGGVMTGWSPRRATASTRMAREMVAWHFDPGTGCDFWLEGEDAPLRSRAWRSVPNLKLLRPLRGRVARGGPIRRWVPKGLAGKPIHAFGTGGSTGLPKVRVNIETSSTTTRRSATGSATRDSRAAPTGSWSGRRALRRLRLSIEHLAQHAAARRSVDLDPRWVNRLVGTDASARLEA